jgi:hypothetical protein
MNKECFGDYNCQDKCAGCTDHCHDFIGAEHLYSPLCADCLRHIKVIGKDCLVCLAEQEAIAQSHKEEVI